LSPQLPIIVLDPSVGPTITEAKYANRLNSLSGKSLGVVNNGKRNSDVFLSALLDAIKDEFQLKEVLWINKKNPSLPVSSSVLEQLKNCHAVVAGVGD
jgi:hypothetical protein